MREENLFYRLTNDDENAASELLCNLCKYDNYKRIIFKRFNIDNDKFCYCDIDTQYRIPQNGKIPDIVIENDLLKIFIENKVAKYTKLKSSQVTDYPEHLKSTKNKDVMLIFLIPKGYKYLEKIFKAQKNIDLSQ
jgi:hypothetical protein